MEEKRIIAIQGSAKLMMVCPACGGKLEHTTRGTMTFSGGEVDDNIEEGYVCSACGYEEWESDYRRDR